MIRTEVFETNGRNFVRTYSDDNRYVVRDGVAYEEACDPAEFGRAYTEGEPIDYPDIDSDEALSIITGVTE